MPMSSIFVGIILAVFAASSALADADSYELNVTRKGVSINAVATRFWSGEYPIPVINVAADKAGTTTVMAFDNLRSPGKAKKCTIKNGIYHPWSKTANSVDLFYSIDSADIYQATADLKLEGISLKKGDRMIVTYLAEGMCQGTVLAKNAKDKPQVDQFSCNLPKTLKSEANSKKQELHEQWLYLKCSEGHKAFVRDEELLQQKGIISGSIVQYGEVGP